MYDSLSSDLHSYYEEEEKWDNALENWESGVKYHKDKIKEIIFKLFDTYKPYFENENEDKEFADRLIGYLEEDIVDIVENANLDFYSDDIYDLINSDYLEDYFLCFLEDYELENQEEFNKVIGY